MLSREEYYNRVGLRGSLRSGVRTQWLNPTRQQWLAIHWFVTLLDWHEPIRITRQSQESATYWHISSKSKRIFVGDSLRNRAKFLRLCFCSIGSSQCAARCGLACTIERKQYYHWAASRRAWFHWNSFLGRPRTPSTRSLSVNGFACIHSLVE